MLFKYKTTGSLEFSENVKKQNLYNLLVMLAKTLRKRHRQNYLVHSFPIYLISNVLNNSGCNNSKLLHATLEQTYFSHFKLVVPSLLVPPTQVTNHHDISSVPQTTQNPLF